ncbi:hypothetical protein [Amycolatopsis echigonensis]|uniref:hypothetical protein n=1 Tax=Amycolatopsis echigonensis TaxID=2576905 RepID=UPI000C70869B|nr:hypothetical protein [Amycolatopsis niigatensis]
MPFVGALLVVFGVFAGLEVEVPVGLWLPSGLGLLDEVELSVVLWPGEVALPVGCEPLGKLVLPACPVPLVALGPLVGFGPAAEL